jgi:hypothetical protein
MDNQTLRGEEETRAQLDTHKARKSSSSMAPKEKLLKLLAKKIVIVKNIMKDLSLDSIPKTMETKDIVQKNMYTINEEVGEKTITDVNVEDEHNDEEKDNLVSTNDDDNIIHVNISNLWFSYQ